MKRLNLLLVAITILALVAACTAPPPAAPQAPAPAPTEAPAAQPEPTKAPEAAAAVHPALADNKITIAWIPKSLNNPVFELGRDGWMKAAELTERPERGRDPVHRFGRLRHGRAGAVIEDAIAQGVDAIGVSCNDPTAASTRSIRLRGRHPGHDLGLRLADSGRFTYLGVSNYDGGKAAATS